MAFAVPAWKRYAISINQVSLQRYVQTTVINITGANTDVDYDLDETTVPGTFFTSAEADGTHGAKATALKAHIVALKAIAAVSWVESPIIGVTHTFYHTTPANNEHCQIVAYTDKIPALAFNAGGAPTDWYLIIHSVLLNSAIPLAAVHYGTI